MHVRSFSDTAKTKSKTVTSVSSVCVSVCVFRASIDYPYRTPRSMWDRSASLLPKKHTNNTLQSPIHSVDTLLKWSDCVLIMSHCRSWSMATPQRNIYNWMHCKSLSRVTVSFLPHTSLSSLSHFFQLQKKSNNRVCLFLFLIKGVNPALSYT